DRLVRVGRARQARDDVAGGHLAGRHVERGVEGGAGQLHRTEVAAARRPLQRLEVETGAAEQVGRDVTLDPGLHGNALRRGVLADDVELRTGPAVLDGGPAVGGRRVLVDDDGPGRALPRRLL